MRPKTYLFPGTVNGWRADKPITAKVIWEAVQQAAHKAWHREARYATYASGTALRRICSKQEQTCSTIQVLMGHKDIEATTRYLARLHQALASSGESARKDSCLRTSNRLQRSRKLHKPE